MKPTHSVGDALRAIGTDYSLVGSAAQTFSRATTLEAASEDAIVWVAKSKPNKRELVAATQAAAIICDPEAAAGVAASDRRTLILVDDPRLAFLRVVARLFQHRPAGAIHPTAVVHAEAKIGSNVYIGPFTYVGRSSVGDDTVIYGHVHLYDEVEIGRRVTIHAGTVIGSDGFGYQRNESGVLEKFPHIGRVVIGDDVEIGANTTIDRGSLGSTIIRERARIDNLVHLAHNVDIGADTAVIANAMIAGSTKVEAGAWVSPSATVRDGVSIGAGSMIGLGALVTKSVPPGETWAGSPAKKWR